ncbi:uncharacterized protein LOC109610246 [Camponotus floridanus]|uniref:uncharacterized protein LOC109610246 n=1 Tax=Camponotus floridanus TaxID=104421 RepID=UPI000DC6B009|nr:uncharacterized protein LOC109610246 [Camponotus floridanus]
MEIKNRNTQSNIPNLRDHWRKDCQHKRVMTFVPKWQTCAANNYYTINRILLTSVGLWPYQNSNLRYIIIVFMIIILSSSVIAQFTTFITTEYNWDLLLQILAYSIPWLGYTLKYSVLCFNIKKTEGLMEQLQRDWNALNTVQEIKIIKKYWAIGRFITLATTLFMYLCIFSFVMMQFLSNFLLDIIMTRNQSHSRRLPVKLEYFVDQEKYFILLLFHVFLIVFCGLTTVIATETLYMSYTQHACGLFQIASCRIEQALHKNMLQSVTSSAEKNLIVHEGIISAVDMYRRANKFVEMSKANFYWAYILLLPLGVLSLSVNLYRFSQLIVSEEYYDLIVSILLIIGHFGYMFFCNYLGQEVINHSSDVFHRTYNVQWYLAPLRAQKLLLLMMQRSMRHCTIVVGGLFIPSFEGFATLTSMAISYFTVIFSTC